MIIAIQPDYGPVRNPERDRSSPRWSALLQEAGHEVRWVDVYRADILRQLRGCQGFMWRHAHHAGMRQIARRLLPVLEREMGLVVYPDQATCWHYDDKIAQAFLFEALGIPTPRTWVWFHAAAAEEWAQTATYPMVMKLWSGACSANVRLVRTVSEALRWIRLLFRSGAHSLAPKGNGAAGLKRRIRAALQLVWRGEACPPPGQNWELHRNYAYFQEFVPHNDFDTRITVIGNRAFGFRRMNRPGDFRASGSGRIDWSVKAIDERAVRLAFEVASRLKAQSVGMDLIQRQGEYLVTEVSYTYASWAVHECPGHWALSGDPWEGCLTWEEGPMWPEQAQVADLLQRLARSAESGRGPGDDSNALPGGSAVGTGGLVRGDQQ